MFNYGKFILEEVHRGIEDEATMFSLQGFVSFGSWIAGKSHIQATVFSYLWNKEFVQFSYRWKNQIKWLVCDMWLTGYTLDGGVRLTGHFLNNFLKFFQWIHSGYK